MTGFALVRKAIGEGEIVVSLKSVNHRGLDLHLHMPPEMDPMESDVRTAVKNACARGHVQVQVSWMRSGGGTAGLNRPLFAAWLAAFR
ncbi:MAG: YicC/YloC family endoribonuclease, partial [Acidimicrobiales bacterium]